MAGSTRNVRFFDIQSPRWIIFPDGIFEAISVPARAVIPASVSGAMPYLRECILALPIGNATHRSLNLRLHQQPLSTSRKKAIGVNLLAQAVL